MTRRLAVTATWRSCDRAGAEVSTASERTRAVGIALIAVRMRNELMRHAINEVDAVIDPLLRLRRRALDQLPGATEVEG
jgi:hypothetical protein